MLLKELDTNHHFWPLARIIKTYPGEDGLTGVADIFCAGQTYKWTIHKLVLLEPEEEQPAHLQGRMLRLQKPSQRSMTRLTSTQCISCTHVCMFMLWFLVGRCWYGCWLPCRCLFVDVGGLPFWFVLFLHAFSISIGHSICVSPIHFHPIYIESPLLFDFERSFRSWIVK